MAVDNMPVAGPVDEEGFFTIWLLNQVYSQFFLTVQTPEPGHDIVWYEAVNNPDVFPGQPEAEIRFVRSETEPPIRKRGLLVGKGLMIG